MRSVLQTPVNNIMPTRKGMSALDGMIAMLMEGEIEMGLDVWCVMNTEDYCDGMGLSARSTCY